MADSFFGFDTTLPDFENKTAAVDLVSDVKGNKDQNLKNEETFSVDLSAIKLSAAEHQNDSLLESSNGNRKPGKGFLTDEYNPLDGVISMEEELEEEEIIENSISQLGLDDEPDENNLKPHPKLQDDGAWGLPTKNNPLDDSAIFMQDLLSPDKRGIWTSPQRSDKSVTNSPQHTSDNGQSDILHDIFGVPSSSRTEASDDINNVNAATPIKAIRAEELERRLTSPIERSDNDEQRTPVIIERRMPKMPAPPPGFVFPMGTPPAGLPWMTPPGMMPVPQMMLSAQMQRMLAASPQMALFNGRGMGMHQGPRGNHPLGQSPFMQNSPRQRGRYWSHQPNNRRDTSGNRSYSNQQNRQWNRREDHHNYEHHYMDEVIKLPPSYLMTSKEKEWLTKIQLMTLISGDMHSTDFYYINYMNKKAAMQKENNEKAEKKKENENETFNKILDIVEQKKEERKYRPTVFQGSLGKLSVATVHHPRQIMDLSAKEQEDDETTRSKAHEGGKKRFVIYGIIEKAYSILLVISDIDRRLADSVDEQKEDLLNEKIVKVNELFNSMKLSLHNWQRDKVNELFLQIMCIAKGKKLVLRALPYFNSEQNECAFLSVLCAVQLLIKKDIHDKILPKFLLLLASVIQRCSEDFLRKIPVAISCNNISHLLTSSVGLNLLILLWDHILMLSSESNNEGIKRILKEWEALKKDITFAVSNLSSKTLEKYPTEIERLKELLRQPEAAFEE